jgi:hypothetical protein
LKKRMTLGSLWFQQREKLLYMMINSIPSLKEDVVPATRLPILPIATTTTTAAAAAATTATLPAAAGTEIEATIQPTPTTTTFSPSKDDSKLELLFKLI